MRTAAMQKNLRHKDSAISSLQDEVAELQAQVANLEGQIAALKDETAKLKAELRAHRQVTSVKATKWEQSGTFFAATAGT